MVQLYIMHKSRNLSEKKRRDQFNMLINELCTMVTASNRKMDKSSVLRSTISFLKNHSELSVQSQSVKVQENWKPSFLSNEEFTHLMLEALDGFIIVFSCNGQILYTSESTASLLGYLPSRIYSSVFDIIHEVDKPTLYKLISCPPNSSNTLPKDSFVSFVLHMKRGPIHSQGGTTYELVQLLGTFYHWPQTYETANPSGFDCDSNSCSSVCSLPPSGLDVRSCFVAVGRLQTPHLLRVVNLMEDMKNEFVSRHSLEWKFLFLDHRAPPIIGYLPFEVLGTSGYDYYHVDDLENIAASHELLMNTGEGTSCFYRFLTKGQQWIWLQTRYYISYHQWNSKPEFIVCTHTVVSAEKVLKNFQEAPKRFPKKPSSNLGCTNSSPSQSACLSPSPSVSSLGSLSSEHSEQCSGKVSSNVRASSVLYASPSHREKISSPLARPVQQRTNQMPPDTFVEPLPHHAPLPQPAPQSGGEMNLISSTGISPQEVQLSSTDKQQSMMSTMSRQEPMLQGFQFQKEQSSVQQPVQVQEYLRRRHQLLQQQIMAQQEELRRVSEQLLMVEMSQPPPASTPYQVTNLTDSASYTESAYTMPHTSQPASVPSSAENHVMRSMQSYTRTTPSFVSTRSYMSLEDNMCEMEAADGLSYMSPTSDVIAQGFSLTHPMPPNT